MSTTTAEAFAEFDENLKLDPKERKTAEDRHNAITTLLLRAGIIVSAFLQGSFARKTMIAPLRDVDKVVVLSPRMMALTADEVMDRVQIAVAVGYPAAAFERSRHALKIDFGSNSFYFDTVPARETTTADDDVYIANRETGNWDRSNTRELIRAVGERNAATNGLFIHQVRMGKQAVKHLLDGIIPGLHVESWAYLVIEEALPHDRALARILEAGAELLGGRYTEPTGEDEISAHLKPDIVTAAKRVLTEAAHKARHARSLTDAGDHNEAIRVWHELLGDCFPEASPQDDATALRRSFQGGAITISGTATTARSTGQSSRPVRSWRTA